MDRTTPSRHDVVGLGRVGVDVYPLQVGVGLEDVSTFGKFLGGSAANVMVAAARLGQRTALWSGVGDDPFGRYVLREMTRFGVDTTLMSVDGELPTPVTFCEVFPPDDFPLYFYRRPSAPDLQISADDTASVWAAAEARLLWTTVTGLSEEPSRAAHHAVWAARGRRPLTVLDLDYRPMFWTDESTAHAEVTKALGQVTVAVGNAEECRVAVGETDPERAADALLDRGVEIAIVKQGPRGVLAKTADDRVVVPPVPVDVVNGLGAGDAFGGSLVDGLLRGHDLHTILVHANAAGAYVAGRLECSTAMPTAADIAAMPVNKDTEPEAPAHV